MIIDNIKIKITNIPDITHEEIKEYIEAITDESSIKPSEMELSLADDGKVVIDYVLPEVPFEHIRRITGYLVGGMNRWNNAKRSEEHDRVKHSL